MSSTACVFLFMIHSFVVTAASTGSWLEHGEGRVIDVLSGSEYVIIFPNREVEIYSSDDVSKLTLIHRKVPVSIRPWAMGDI